MDEVLEQLSALGTDSASESQTNFEGLYKNWGRLGNQEERRKEILEVQKTNRNNKLDKFRGILELVNAVEQNNIFRTHNRAYYRPNIYVAGFHRASASYSNVLMLSEWMIEKPADFNENWYVVPCPKGVRMLVVANQGSTKCYTKHGHLRHTVSTALPGGSPHTKKYNNCCVLDCFYVEQVNTMYILDLLAWNSQPMTDGETEFRHYWLEQQLSDITDLQTIRKKRNEMIFKIIPKTPCDPESFQKFMLRYPAFPNDTPAIDGLLFYHKRAHYFAGQTPLVGWLYPYMVPEVLGADIELNAAYALGKPLNYVNQADFIEKFEAKQAKRDRRSRTRNSNSNASSMDTADPDTAEASPKNKNKPQKVLETGDMEVEEIKETNRETAETMESESTEKTEETKEATENTNNEKNNEEINEENKDENKEENKEENSENMETEKSENEKKE